MNNFNTKHQQVYCTLPKSNSEIAVSPNGIYIAYIGTDNKLYYYKDINSQGWSYTYHKPTGTPNNAIASNSLRYTSNSTLFYNSRYYVSGNIPVNLWEFGDQKVHYFNLQESYCENPAIKVIEPNYVPLSYDPTKEIEDTIRDVHVITINSSFNKPNDSLQITIYPNPASKEIYIDLINSKEVNASYKLINSLGNTVSQGVLKTNSNTIQLNNTTSGVYIITIFDKTNNYQTNHKIVIQK